MYQQFVGRKQWVDRFNDYMHPDEGLIWRITGVPGIGKSTLMRKFAQRCEEAGRMHVFLDIEGLQAGHGLDVLSELSKSARYFDTENSDKPLREKMAERFVQYKGGLGSVLEVGKLVDPSGGLIAGGAKVLLDLGLGLAGSAANMSEEMAAVHPELFLLNALAAAADDNKKPICLVDTFEHALAGNLKIQSCLDFGFPEPRESTLKTKPLAAWLLSLFKFLRSKGWRVVIAGRNMKGAAVKDQLNRFTRDEIAQAASQRPDLGPYMSDQADAIIDVLATLSFKGNPLWLQVAMNLLEGLLAQGEDLEALAKKPDYLHQCFEEEDPFDSGEDYGIEGGQCKLQLIGTLTRHIEGLEDQAWKIALPRVLDKGIVGQLFEADQARVVLHNFEVAGVFRHSGKQFSLHEEIRDLLLAYARSKGWLESEETREIHGRLWEYLNEFYLGQLPGELCGLVSRMELKGEDDFDDIEAQLKQYISLNWILEACFHRIFSLEELSENSISPMQFWNALGGAVDWYAVEKWKISEQLPHLGRSQISELIKGWSDDLEYWRSILGEDSTEALSVAELAGHVDIINDTSFWAERVKNYGLAGDYYGLQVCLLEQPEELLITVDQMLEKYQSSDDSLTEIQCAKALFNKAYVLDRELNDLEAAIFSYDELIARYGELHLIETQKQSAKALISKGLILGVKMNDPEAEVVSYDELLRRYGELEHPLIQEQCSIALFFKGLTLGNQLNSPEAALAVYDDLLNRYGKLEKPKFQVQCTKALYNKGWTLSEKLNNPEAALAAYDELLNCYGSLEQPVIQEHCAEALCDKGMILSSLGDLSSAINCYEYLLTHYIQNESPEIQQNCQSGRLNLAELLLVVGRPEIALVHINQLFEQGDKTNENYAVVHFLQWLASPDVSQQAIFNAIRQLPLGTEFDWSWSEIRPLINKLSEPRKTQAEHYIAFFEEHQNIERLESDLESVTL